MRRVPLPAALFDLLERNASARHAFALPDEAAHYVRTVLRLDEGSPVELFDGSGRLARATLTTIDASMVIAEVEAPRSSQRGEPPVELILFQAIPKGDRWEWLLEKATELGVTTLVPLTTRRGVVQLSSERFEKKRPRWEKILAGAARQCRRACIPELRAPHSPTEAFQAYPNALHLVAHLSDDLTSVHRALHAAEHRGDMPLGDAPRPIGLWVGPEGGFEDAEINTLLQAGARCVTLGPRVLRAETAGVALLTLVQNALGEF
ncbi:16S rRNA (uracil(1498)-N(3))-methyltransferase [Lujinxingia litoralis]|uniref:Ribosomal RNA small subunit methyltransferase E n=1 Tax=Lujinxingia litoralis TaxID=2211119 RepID=A0A328C8M6_9DELT|nr:16S rRNA (uracil(1498)-N(3))-methyltransferase [Lujinxingia litoralis]RAL22964.1 16S rRNA (uracil(1498)-N(3))-methyltransferase [Lujinxingia litoralis]